MAGFGPTTRMRGNPRSRGRMRSRSGLDRATLGIVGQVRAIAGFFTLGIVLGPVAVVSGWPAVGRSWSGARGASPSRPSSPWCWARSTPSWRSSGRPVADRGVVSSKAGGVRRFLRRLPGL